ncbi:MAG: efflux RND transporter periplasmic adaptor subunit [Candidatus Shapirobacteria bacterium]|nr:efflux RND transporter periplasmic adaptor subunit [Candidatus Shapirobacteria bacterium]
MSFLKKNFKKIIITIIVIIIGFGIFKLKIQSQSNIEIKFNSKTETIINPKRETIKDEITLTGSVDAALKSDLRFQTSGQLAWVGVKIGDKVKKYQAIASLNKEELKKQLQIDFNNYKTAASNFYDKTDEYKDSVLTTEVRRILDRNQNTLDNSVINYELQDLAIKYATLVSPIAGIVTNIDQPSNGVNVTPSSATFSIIDPNSIYFKSKIDQEDVPKIKVGDKATIKLDSFSDQTFESQITHIAFTPVSGESSTVYEIRLNLPTDNNNDLKYRIGMDGDVSIPLKIVENALTVPTDSLHQENDQYYVLVKEIDKSNLIKKYVKTGIETDTIVEILEGLSENDQIVIAK